MNQQLLRDMIDIVRGDKKLEETSSFAGTIIDSDTRRSIPRILAWLFVQDFPGDIEATKHDVSFSSKQIARLVSASPEVQVYFQIKDGALAFADDLGDEEALEMIQYVKQNYRPQVHF
jgi:hypothetical protein